jgi:HTH-type transcriptional regulator/antitoxin HigA
MTEPRPAAWASPPGETIEDLLEERGWSKKELAVRLDCTPKHVSELLKGEAPIHADLAMRLSLVLGSTPEFWLQREADYRAARQRKATADLLSADAGVLDELPLPWLLHENVVPYRAHKGEQVEQVLRFFGVGSVGALRQTYTTAEVAWRTSAAFGKQPGAVAAWLRCAELAAEKVRTATWNERAFREALPGLRALTSEVHPTVFVPALTKACAACGVTVVFVRTPAGCAASGCTRWITPERALLVLSLGHATNDHLWFTFFHEAGHLVLHSKKRAFIEGLDGLDPISECDADAFARDLLVPPGFAPGLARLKSAAPVIAFARRVGLHPGIVVGRLQRDGVIAQSHLENLKVRYDWTDENPRDR